MATRIIAVLNQKGGVGKTTTCVNLGAALARRGQEVLLVDIDPQANLTVHVGVEPRTLKRTTYSLLLGDHGIAEAIAPTSCAGLTIVPSTLALANAEIQLASAVGRELLLREALDAWLGPQPSTKADFVLIDCPPSLGILTMNALCAATEVLLPIQTEFFALQGVAGILESLKAVQRLNRGLKLSMVVPCMVDRRTTLARDVIAEVRKYFGNLVTRQMVGKNIKLAEAPSHGKTIFEYDPGSNGARDYDALAAEVLGEVEIIDDEDLQEESAAAAPEAVLVESASVESASVESASVESASMDAVPVESAPVEADPVEAVPAAAAPSAVEAEAVTAEIPASPAPATIDVALAAAPAPEAPAAPETDARAIEASAPAAAEAAVTEAPAAGAPVPDAPEPPPHAADSPPCPVDPEALEPLDAAPAPEPSGLSSEESEPAPECAAEEPDPSDSQLRAQAEVEEHASASPAALER